MAVGEHFRFENGDELGFVTTRWVEAKDSLEAKRITLDLVQSELRGNYAEENSPNAKIEFEEVNEVANGDRAPGAGFTWFPMEQTNSTE